MAGGGKGTQTRQKKTKTVKHAHVLKRVKDYKTPECANS